MPASRVKPRPLTIHDSSLLQADGAVVALLENVVECLLHQVALLVDKDLSCVGTAW